MSDWASVLTFVGLCVSKGQSDCMGILRAGNLGSPGQRASSISTATPGVLLWLGDLAILNGLQGPPLEGVAGSSSG